MELFLILIESALAHYGGLGFKKSGEGIIQGSQSVVTAKLVIRAQSVKLFFGVKTVDF